MADVLCLDAVLKNLPAVMAFVDAPLAELQCSPKVKNNIELSAEEIFVNIVQYAYPSGEGTVVVERRVETAPPTLWLTFRDHGTPYDPLQHPTPDLEAKLEERPIGGLGIYLVRSLVDEVRYEYLDGQNVLTIKKHIK